jgi:hypothetical protein
MRKITNDEVIDPIGTAMSKLLQAVTLVDKLGVKPYFNYTSTVI